MIVAELRGKLSEKENRTAADISEDVLTSNVFGLLRYLPAGDVLLPWLATAIPRDASASPLLADASDATLEFWPRLRQRELDLYALVSTPRGQELIGIECKYTSGASPATILPDLPSPTWLVKTGNQLADYWDALVHDAVEPRTWATATIRRSLVYLTLDNVLPETTFDDALKHLRKEAQGEAKRSFFWLQWQSLPGVLRSFLACEKDPLRHRVAKDLLDLLVAKRLDHFQGFGQLARPPQPKAPAFRALWALPAPASLATPAFYTSARKVLP